MRLGSHSWVEISRSALAANMRVLRGLCAPTTRLAPVVELAVSGGSTVYAGEVL